MMKPIVIRLWRLNVWAWLLGCGVVIAAAATKLNTDTLEAMSIMSVATLASQLPRLPTYIVTRQTGLFPKGDGGKENTS